MLRDRIVVCGLSLDIVVFSGCLPPRQPTRHPARHPAASRPELITARGLERHIQPADVERRRHELAGERRQAGLQRRGQRSRQERVERGGELYGSCGRDARLAVALAQVCLVIIRIVGVGPLQLLPFLDRQPGLHLPCRPLGRRALPNAQPLRLTPLHPLLLQTLSLQA
jgi:hypothetical protein